MWLPELPRILLVHGAFADGSGWSKVIPHLQHAGYNVTAVQNPMTSLGADINTTRHAIETLNNQSDAPIVVVGHSFGGFVVTNAATDQPNIKSLVYVTAFAPDEGESPSGLASMFPALESAKHFVPDVAGRIKLPQDQYPIYFAPDVNKEEVKVLAATQGPCDQERFLFNSSKPAWKQVKNLYAIKATEDQIIHPDLEDFMAKRMGAKLTTLEGGSHASLWSRGKEVADVILEAAKC
jgi:pimeloyl-ACP methyl ester carboxylesterase